MSKIPLGALQAFVAAARTRNLTRAAAQLHLTVSALSHQMRGLEERLGKRLLVRSARGVELSAEGQRLFDTVGAPLDTIERAISKLNEPARDTFTLSVLASFASSWLMPRLGRFMALHPGLQINVQTSSSLVDFEREPVDAALRYGRGQWPGVQADFLLEEWISPVASPALLKRAGKPKAGDDLSRWPLLGDPGEQWPEWFSLFGGSMPKRFVAKFTDSDLLLKAAAEGMGIGLGRATLAQPLLDNGTLIALSGRRLRSDYSHYLVYPQRSQQHPALATFRTWLFAEAEQSAPTRAVGSKVASKPNRGAAAR
jgi:LysR family transcriptional regulator, glycine cleavage system transcriptional activator